MKLRWAAKNTRPIAVDFGSDRMKLLQVSTDDPPRLVAAASMEVPLSLRATGSERDEYLADALGDLLKRGGFNGRRAVLAVPSSLTHIQHVRIGRNETADVDAQVAEQLRGKLPVGPEALVIRNVRVGEVFDDGSARQEVIAMATTRQTVMRCISLAGKARLAVVGMHCEPLAIARAFAHLYRREGDEKQTTFFIDIGQTTTKALLTHGRQLVFAKSIRVAGEHFDRLLAKQMEVELDEARDRRRAIAAGQPIPGPTPRRVDRSESSDRRTAGDTGSGLAMLAAATETEPPPEQPAPAVTPDGGEMLDCLIDELQLCAGYHGSMFPDRPIDKVVFLGGQAHQRSMCQQIARSLRLPAQVGDPLQWVSRSSDAAAPINVDLRQAQPGWAVPMGLGLLPTNL